MPLLRPGSSASFLSVLCGVSALLAWLAPGLTEQPIVVALLWSALVLTTVDAAWRAASRLLPTASTSVFLLGTCLLWESLAAGTVTLLGAIGAFRLPIMLAWLACLALLVRRHAGAPRSFASVLGGLPFARRFDAQCAALFVLLLAAFAVVVLNQVRYTVQDADSMWYHLVMPAEWVRTGSIRPIEAIPSMGIAYPGFRHTLLAFLSLAPRHEHLALLGVLEFPLLAMSVYGVARSFGARAATALGAGVYAAMTPVVLASLSTQGNDLSLSIHVLLSIVFVGRFFASGDKQDALLAGLALGATAAIKFSGPGYAGIIVLVAVLQHGWRRWWSWAGVSVLAIGGLVLAAPWYVRNFWVFGNPLWPAKIYLGDRVVLEGVYDKAYFQKHMLGWNVQPLLDHLEHFSDAHGWLVPIGAAGALLVLAAAVLRRCSWREALAACVLPPLLFVAFLHHPFNAPWFDAGYTHRYMIVWFCVAAAASAAGLSLLTPRWVPWGCLWAVGAAFGLATVTRLAWPIAGLATAATALACTRAVQSWLSSVLSWLLARAVPPALVWLAVAGLAFGVARQREHWQYDPELGYHDALSERGWGPCVAFVHRNVHDARVGMHGGFFFFPLLGEPWSNQVLLADDLVWLQDRKTTEQVAAWAEEQELDYLVCNLFRSERTASKQWTFEPSIGMDLVVAHPEQFAVVLESRGAHVLRVRRTGRR